MSVLRFASLLGMVVIPISVPSFASAEESAYCRKVKARAEADAILLLTPKVIAQAIRFPSNGRVGESNVSASGADVELRAGLEYSPVDALRGHFLTGVADADCSVHAASRAIDEVLVQDTDASRLVAHRAEVEYLTTHRPEWQALLSKADEAVRAGLLTIAELHELHRLTSGLERRRLRAGAEVARLQVKTNSNPTLPSAALGRSYVEQAGHLEHEVSKLRSLDPWTFSISGGVVPLEGEPVEWFGFAEIGYSLGGLARGSKEARYREARQHELLHAPYELSGKLALFRKVVATDLANAESELQAVTTELEFIRGTLDRFAGGDTLNGIQGRAQVTLERIATEADAAFLRAQIRQLSLLGESIRDS